MRVPDRHCIRTSSLFPQGYHVFRGGANQGTRLYPAGMFNIAHMTQRAAPSAIGYMPESKRFPFGRGKNYKNIRAEDKRNGAGKSASEQADPHRYHKLRNNARRGPSDFE